MTRKKKTDAITLIAERVVTLREAAKLLPTRPHLQTVRRWARVGVHGVRLETIRLGSTVCTSVEALQRFAEALTAQEAVA